MQSDERLGLCTLCDTPAQIKNQTGMVEFWPWCFEHLVDKSIKADQAKKSEESRVCANGCGWPSVFGSICVRCARNEAELLYREDQARRQAEYSEQLKSAKQEAVDLKTSEPIKATTKPARKKVR